MRYDISLQMTFVYQAAAVNARQIVHLMPADRPGRQRLIAGNLSFTPLPTRREDRFDFFGNAETAVALDGAVKTVDIHLQARVDVIGNAFPEGLPTPPDALAGTIADWRDLGPSSPVHFCAPTLRTPADPDIAAYARQATAGNDNIAARVEALGLALHRDMRFDPNATTVDTSAAEAFAERHGVCQDFTHIMISGLRSLGIPAGYVSGFIRTIPPPGQPRIEGGDAMHAWVSGWCGPHGGWVEYDPTNATFAGPDHVVVAYGRDYGEVAPVKGIMRTAGGQTSDQAVDVIPLGATG